MKNNYTPVADSDESFKTLNDEKSDTHSLDDTGTPPPYSAPNNPIDLEMADLADESAHHSTSRFDRSILIIQKALASILFSTSIGYTLGFCIFALFFGLNAHANEKTFWGFFGSFIAAFVMFLLVFVMPKEWFARTCKMLSYLSTQACRILPNMCVATLITALGNAFCFALYYVVKVEMEFEKMNDIVFYVVCIVNVALFVNLTRIGMGNYVRPTDAENETPQNEEIELQPLADQSEEV